MAVFKIDGREFDVIVTVLKRGAAVLDGDKAGRTLDVIMHRDIKGTFYNYTMEISANSVTVAQYDELYEILTAPVDSHKVEFPYAQATLVFDAYIANADDELLRMAKRFNLWGKLSVKFTAMKPARRP